MGKLIIKLPPEYLKLSCEGIRIFQKFFGLPHFVVKADEAQWSGNGLC